MWQGDDNMAYIAKRDLIVKDTRYILLFCFCVFCEPVKLVEIELLNGPVHTRSCKENHVKCHVNTAFFENVYSEMMRFLFKPFLDILPPLESTKLLDTKA